MKTIQHTPGPWSVAGESCNDHEAYVIEAGGRTICWTASSLDDAGIEVITAEDDANADLLAAAPDLLSALESLLEDHKRMFPEAHPHSVIKWAECAEVSRAQKAISKAKGLNNMSKPNQLEDSDYILSQGAAWLEVKNFAIRIHATNEGVVVDIYRNGDEASNAIASAYAFDSELED